MRKKVINSIKNELDLYETSNDEKHLYTVEKLVQLLKDKTPVDDEPTKDVKKEARPLKKCTLDNTYIAGESKTSIFDF